MFFNRNAFKNTVLFLLLLCIACGNDQKIASFNTDKKFVNHSKKVSTTTIDPSKEAERPDIIVGANQTELYVALLKNKNIGIVGNQTSVIFKGSKENIQSKHIHIVDSLLSLGINIKKVFAPEHGFRGKSDAGEIVKNGKDVKTGLPIISLYGKNKKPSKESLQDIDLIVFDIQDVGVRYYTYISTLHYVMQTCAENNIPVLILDRPNPNGHYIDGPTLEIEHKSFVGMHPIPSVHGMTIGEYAQMINGEKWLGNDLTCNIAIIPVKHYDHQTAYNLPIRPSPNLPNDRSINLYPSLGFFEGTTFNAGRGTEMQFQIFGSPDLTKEFYDFEYTPTPNFGAKEPKHKGIKCIGKDLRKGPRLDRIHLDWLINAYTNTTNKKTFFKDRAFTIHSGTEKLRKQIEQGYTAREIRKTWLKGLEAFKIKRKKYLLYP